TTPPTHPTLSLHDALPIWLCGGRTRSKSNGCPARAHPGTRRQAPLYPPLRPLPFAVPPAQQEHRKFPRAPHALLQRVLLDPFVPQVLFEFLQGLPHEFLKKRSEERR